MTWRTPSLVATFLAPLWVSVAGAADLVVDAGDSRFVGLGEPVTLSATAYGGSEPVRFAWDTDGDGVADREGQAIHVDTAPLGTGAHTFTVTAEDSLGRVATDAVKGQVHAPVT